MDIEYFIKNWKNIKEEDIDFTICEWKDISSYEYLPEEFMEKYQDKVYWNYISTDQNLSEEFIEKYENKVDWYLISKYQKLSEAFIEKFEDKVNWLSVSMLQSLSIEFVFKNKEKISHLDCVDNFYRFKYKACGSFLVQFYIYKNNSYALFIKLKKGEFNVIEMPLNIVFEYSIL